MLKMVINESELPLTLKCITDVKDRTILVVLNNRLESREKIFLVARELTYYYLPITKKIGLNKNILTFQMEDLSDGLEYVKEKIKVIIKIFS